MVMGSVTRPFISVHVMKGGLEKHAISPTAPELRTALIEDSAMPLWRFQSVRTAFRVTWDLRAMIHAPTDCRCRWTAVIVSVFLDTVALVATASALNMETSLMARVSVTKNGGGLCVMFQDVQERTKIARAMVIATERSMNALATKDGPGKVRFYPI